ncbi:MAG TPA: DUF1737 domain-containing protein [Candidatus Tectomicrobia bacterium]
MIVFYYTEFAKTVTSLDVVVNSRLQDGWELYGNPYVVQTPREARQNAFFCQAMVKRGEKKEGDARG